MLGLGLATSAQATDFTLGLGNSGNNANSSDPAIITATNYIAPGFAGVVGGGISSFTFEYDISGLGIGTVDTIEVTAVAGSSVTDPDLLNAGGQFGLAVQGGDSNLRLDFTETLSFTTAIFDGGVDVTGDWDIDLIGFEARTRGLATDLGSFTYTTGVGNIATTTSDTSIAYRSSGAFSQDGLSFVVSRFGDGVGNAGAIASLGFSVVAVPEPSTYALLGGLIALSAVMVRRRK